MYLGAIATAAVMGEVGTVPDVNSARDAMPVTLAVPLAWTAATAVNLMARGAPMGVGILMAESTSASVFSMFISAPLMSNASSSAMIQLPEIKGKKNVLI